MAAFTWKKKKSVNCCSSSKRSSDQTTMSMIASDGESKCFSIGGQVPKSQRSGRDCSASSAVLLLQHCENLRRVSVEISHLILPGGEGSTLGRS